MCGDMCDNCVFGELDDDKKVFVKNVIRLLKAHDINSDASVAAAEKSAEAYCTQISIVKKKNRELEQECDAMAEKRFRSKNR